MSILDEIQRRCDENPPLLHRLTVSSKDPGIANAPTPRAMFISPEIKDFLDSKRPLAQPARADLENFILGATIVAALYRDHKYCRMARLDRPADEVWEVRVLDSDPQLRIFGRFARRDVFVALIGPDEHEYVETDDDYEGVKTECQDEWRNLFGVRSPVRGKTIYDYISKPVRLV